MIWTISQVDDLLCQAFVDAGPIDQGAIDRATRGQGPRYQEARPGVKRYYYLLADNPRISLAALGMPLDNWQGGAFLIVGTRTIIGEFELNKPHVGKLGLQLKMQPIAWMQGMADKQFRSGQEVLAEISEQVLDRREIERSQERIQKKYEWNMLRDRGPRWGPQKGGNDAETNNCPGER